MQLLYGTCRIVFWLCGCVRASHFSPSCLIYLRLACAASMPGMMNAASSRLTQYASAGFYLSAPACDGKVKNER